MTIPRAQDLKEMIINSSVQDFVSEGVTYLDVDSGKRKTEDSYANGFEEGTQKFSR